MVTKAYSSSQLPRFNSLVLSAGISTLICTLVILYLMLTTDKMVHWFVIPVFFSGCVIGIDMVNWLRGRLAIFDPVGILGLLGFHFFFLAPLLHVHWDQWVEPWYPTPQDWRPWLGEMAFLNLFGLLFYCLFRTPWLSRRKVPQRRVTWRIYYQRFFPLLAVAMLLAAGLQLLVYVRFGGITAYIAEATDLSQEGASNFQNLGIVFLISESFPLLALIGFVMFAKNRQWLRRWWVLLAVIVIFLGLQLLFGGLRGSRSNVVWALFWAVGIIHLWLHPITRKHIVFGLLFLVFFMYFYGFFKAGGLEGLQNAFAGGKALAQLEQDSGRDFQSMLLGDMGRSDVQALMLYRISQPDSDYQYAAGRTYAAATTILLPSTILPDKPPNKSKEGTELFFGAGTYQPGVWVSSKVYGLAGEAMLNFGPVAVPFVFIPFGFLVGWVRRCSLTWPTGDSRLLLLPMMVNLCFVVLVSDMDNNVFFLFKNAGLPTLLIALGTKRAWINHHL